MPPSVRSLRFAPIHLPRVPFIPRHGRAFPVSPRILRHAGFTLIELMIALAVVAILAGIAIPQYGELVLRSQLSTATGTLKEARARMEQRYADNRAYTGGCAIPNFLHADSGFNFACVPANAGQSFVFTATGTGRAVGFVYTIDEAGVERTTGVRSGWTSTAPPVNRFIVRRGS